jgi:uncharacterized protein YndB with AHSA1/START domain
MTHQPFSVSEAGADSKFLVLVADFLKFSPISLFEHFTNPALLVRWWPQVAVIDPRPGGKYQFSWPVMKWDLVGEFTHFEPGRHLGFSWFWLHEPQLPVRQVHLTFEPLNSGSRLRLKHGSYSTEARDQADRQSHLEGWKHFLQRLSALE